MSTLVPDTVVTLGYCPNEAGTGTFSCFHCGEEKQPPLDEASLTDGNKIRRGIEEYYDEAARRLPLNEMPELRGCIHAGGHCFGLGDPVTNIILNAIALLRREHPPWQIPTGGWFEIASRSHTGLRAFMTAYFRYLSITQAQRYLCLASHDLSLAIKLVHHDRFASSSSGGPRFLLPDGDKIKAALRIAALEAHHPAPDVLAGLMTARYPSDLLYPVMAIMQQQQPLSTDQVREIEELLAKQWPPTPSLANLEFCLHPDSSWTAPRHYRGREGTPLKFSIPIGGDKDLMARICIERTTDYFHHHRQHEYMSKLLFQNADSKIKLPNLWMSVNKARGNHGSPSFNCDASPCEHMRYLKMHLLETIHASYIKALAKFPSSAWSTCLLHALLVAGHCYGPLDCVSNIILNSIWYSIAFPLAQGAEVQLPQGILCTKALSRMESCSLYGMVAILRGTFKSDNEATCKSEHEAFGFLNHYNCNFIDNIYLNSSDIPFSAAAKAAKHPQHAAFASFHMALPLSKRSHLSWLLAQPGRISDANWDKINTILREESACNAMLQIDMEAPSDLSPFVSQAVSTLALDFKDKLTFVCTELNKVLREYCYKNPWEPIYKLDIVCGVMESSRSFCHPNLYHANFLVSRDEVEANDSYERKLFFAEFWGPYSSPDVQLKLSNCSPVSDYFACTGRCTICETEGSRGDANMIVHPPSGGHSGDIKGLVDLYPDKADTFYGDRFLRVPSIVQAPITSCSHEYHTLPEGISRKLNSLCRFC
ncbi:unnamed protein product [Urochloa decumbens]|uniref:Uncharacterized protein n=1 Tax=Urochloa decumbens TaxID=240449 RepID=A0ABC8W2N7_9POAL